MKKFFIIFVFFIASYNLFCQSINFEDIKFQYEQLITNSDLESLRNFSLVLDLYSQGNEYNSLKKHLDYEEAFIKLNQTTKKTLHQFDSPWKNGTTYFSSKLISENFYYFITIHNTYITKRIIFYRSFYAISITFIIFAFTIFIILISVKKEKQKNLLMTQALIKGQETERKRISEELHDTIAQNLKIQKLQILNTIENSKVGEKIEDELDEILKISKNNITEIRSICQNLFPPDFENQQLDWIVAELCDNINKGNKISCSYFIDPESIFTKLNKEDKLNFFRIIQEAINNCVTHAECTSIQIFIAKKELVISDNGKGFDYQKTLFNKSNHFGLRSMKERAALLKGTIEVKSNNKGTVIKLKI